MEPRLNLSRSLKLRVKDASGHGWTWVGTVASTWPRPEVGNAYSFLSACPGRSLRAVWWLCLTSPARGLPASPLGSQQAPPGVEKREGLSFTWCWMEFSIPNHRKPFSFFQHFGKGSWCKCTAFTPFQQKI